MRTRTGLALIAPLVACGLVPVAASEDPLPDDFNALFAFTCLKHFHAQDKLPAWIRAHGLEKLPADQAEFFLEDRPGDAWIMVTPGTRYVVSLREDRVCSVFAQRADPDSTRSGFIALVGTAPPQIVAKEEFGRGLNNDHERTVGYSWSRPKDEAALLFLLTTSDRDDAEIQAMASIAEVRND